MITIYVERSGGKWEARYWHTDEMRYFRFSEYDRATAIRKCVKATGYKITDAKIVAH